MIWEVTQRQHKSVITDTNTTVQTKKKSQPTKKSHAGTHDHDEWTTDEKIA